MRKLILAAMLVAPLSLSGFPGEAAAAKVTLDFSVGINLSGGKRISCPQGRRSIERRGFHDVRMIDCHGKLYVYRAWRHRDYFEIVLRSRDGRVADYRRLR